MTTARFQGCTCEMGYYAKYWIFFARFKLSSSWILDSRWIIEYMLLNSVYLYHGQYSMYLDTDVTVYAALDLCCLTKANLAQSLEPANLRYRILSRAGPICDRFW